MDKEYTITKVVEIMDSQYGKKARFFVEGYEEELSCFTKWPAKIREGTTLYGHIEIKGSYHNFKWGRKPKEGSNDMQFDLINAKLDRIISILE
jgi:hypothetical protein